MGKVFLLLNFVSHKSKLGAQHAKLLNVTGFVLIVQSPAPVYEIKVEPSVTWAIVSWKLHADASASSYITQIVVYCNDRRFETVSRGILSVTVTGLQSNTWYIVGIHTVDGYLENSNMVYKRFQTKKSAGIQRKVLYLCATVICVFG